MTAMMSSPAGAHFFNTAPPRSGILLNASPVSSAPNSPKRTPYLLSPFPSVSGAGAPHHAPPSSHSSASSSTSSTDDIVSSTSATSAGAPLASSSSSHPSRKIRFAPLPEPRREYDGDLLSPGFYPEIDSAQSSPRTAAHALLSPPLSPHVTPATPTTRAAHYGESHAHGSCSTLGLSLDGMELPDSGQATETNTIVGSDCGTDETHTQSNSKKKGAKWARLLRLPKPAPLKTALRTPDESQFSLWRSSSRESTASTSSFRGMLGSLSDSNASTASLGGPLSRRKSAGVAESVPVSPALSFRGGLSLKPVVSEAGTAASPAVRGSKAHAHTSSAPPTVRRGTRLLNGRVYGSRGSSSVSKNPFANVRDEEPEFVEWGHGGMGSVRGSAGAAAAKQYAALQSNKKLSIGHEDGSKGGNAAEDDDDGSGMGWVKRRREQRERERKEAEEREAREKGKEKQRDGAGEADVDVKSENVETEHAVEKSGKEEELERESSEVPMKEPESTTKEVPGPVSPADASEVKETREKEEKTSEGEEVKTEEEKQKEREKEYVHSTVSIPAPRPHHHHTHSHHSAHSHTRSIVNSSVPSPAHSAAGTPTVEVHLHSPLGTPGAVAPHNPSPLAVPGSSSTLHVFENGSPPSSSASSSFEEDGSVVDEKGEDREEREGDEDEDDEENEQARKTAIGAGVEKISRHKD